MSEKNESPVVLVETLGAMQVFNLPHEVYCEAVGACSCETRLHPKIVRTMTGKAGIDYVEKRAPKSITLLPRAESEELHPAALQCPEIVSALKARPRRVTFRVSGGTK